MSTHRRSEPSEDVDDVPSRRRDDGTTLVEIMISMVLIGVVLAAVLGAVQMSIRSSSLAFDGAQLETVLINANDKVTRAPQLCNYDEYVRAAMQAQQWSPDDISVAVEKLIPQNGAVAAYWTPQNCPADVRPFDVQRLTITATEPSGRITRSITMVKSDVS